MKIHTDLRNYTSQILHEQNYTDSLLDGDGSIKTTTTAIFTTLKDCVEKDSIDPIVNWFNDNPIDLNNIRITFSSRDRTVRGILPVVTCNFMELCYMYTVLYSTSSSMYEFIFECRKTLCLMKKIILEAVKYGLDIKRLTPCLVLHSVGYFNSSFKTASNMYAVFCMGEIMDNVERSSIDKDIYTSHLLQYKPSDTLNFIESLEDNIDIVRPLVLSYMRYNNIIERYITNIVDDQYNSIYISNTHWTFPALSISNNHRNSIHMQYWHYMLTADPYCTKGLLRAGLNTRGFMQTIVDDCDTFTGPCSSPFSISTFTMQRHINNLWFNADSNDEHLFRRNTIHELHDNPISIIDYISNVTDYLVMYGTDFNKMVKYDQNRSSRIIGPAFHMMIYNESKSYVQYIMALRLYTKYIKLLNPTCGYSISNVTASRDYDISEYTSIMRNVYSSNYCRFELNNTTTYTSNYSFFNYIRTFILTKSMKFTSKEHYYVYYNQLSVGNKRKYTNIIRKLLKEAYANILNVTNH